MRRRRRSAGGRASTRCPTRTRRPKSGAARASTRCLIPTRRPRNAGGRASIRYRTLMRPSSAADGRPKPPQRRLRGQRRRRQRGPLRLRAKLLRRQRRDRRWHLRQGSRCRCARCALFRRRRSATRAPLLLQVCRLLLLPRARAHDRAPGAQPPWPMTTMPPPSAARRGVRKRMTCSKLMRRCYWPAAGQRSTLRHRRRQLLAWRLGRRLLRRPRLSLLLLARHSAAQLCRLAAARARRRSCR